MISSVNCKDIQQLYSTPIVQQTAFWSAVKRKLGSSPLAINFSAKESALFGPISKNKNIESDLLVVIQKIDGQHSIAYVPYGPELEPHEENQGAFLEELSECLRSFIPKNCILIRYDLCWESYWTKDFGCYDQEGNWMGEPAISSQEFRFNFNTINWNFKKASFNILPSNTIFIDLRQDIPDILSRMRAKTRYNINLAARKGVSVRKMGVECLDVWYKLYQETAARNHIYLSDLKYFEAVLSTESSNSQSPAEVLLLVAEIDDFPLAAMFLIITGNRGSYLYGASTSEHRNLMATYALQWEAIKISKEKGCTQYDLFGVSPNPDPAHPLYGLYKFKIGFGGDLYHSMGCWDYPLQMDKYNYFKSVELNGKGFHIS